VASYVGVLEPVEVDSLVHSEDLGHHARQGVDAEPACKVYPIEGSCVPHPLTRGTVPPYFLTGNHDATGCHLLFSLPSSSSIRFHLWADDDGQVGSKVRLFPTSTEAAQVTGVIQGMHYRIQASVLEDVYTARILADAPEGALLQPQGPTHQ